MHRSATMSPGGHRGLSIQIISPELEIERPNSTPKVEFYFVSCGQTDTEVKGLFENPYVGKVTQKGKEQLDALGFLLKGIHFNGVFCSPAGVAVESLSILDSTLLKRAQKFDALGPYRPGVLELHPVEEWVENCKSAEGCPVSEYKVRGAESLDNFRKRIREAIFRMSGVVIWGQPDSKILPPEGKAATILKPLPSRDNGDSLRDYPWLPRERPKMREKVKCPIKRIMVVTHEAWIKEAVQMIPGMHSRVKEVELSPQEERQMMLHLGSKEITKQYFPTNQASLSIIEIWTDRLDLIRKVARTELTDFVLNYSISLVRNTDHYKYIPSKQNLTNIMGNVGKLIMFKPYLFSPPKLTTSNSQLPSIGTQSRRKKSTMSQDQSQRSQGFN